MIFSLLFVEKEGLGRPSSPQLPWPQRRAELLHLLYESKHSNKHLLLAGSASGSHTACAAGIVARSRNAESLGSDMGGFRRVMNWNGVAKCKVAN